MSKTAIVTGASRGLGRAIAIGLAEDGYNIVINYAGNTAAAEETKAAVEAHGVQAITVQGDVSDKAAVDALVQTAIDTFGSVEVLVNNAGIVRDKLMRRMKEEDWDAVLNTNLKGVFLMTQAVSPYMVKARRGAIVNISSIVGEIGNRGQANYSAAKAGVIGLTKATAKEFASRGVRANAVAPGFIETDMTAVLSDAVKQQLVADIPLGHMGQPQDIAEAVRYLVSDRARFVTGAVLDVNGGMAM